MTRQEFIDDVTTWYELIEFCYDENLDYCENIYDEESYDDKINSKLAERAGYDSWQDIYDWLNSLPNGYEYYIVDEDEEWYAAGDDDFDRIKGEVLEYMDDNDCWDEDEEEEPREYIDPEDEIPVEEEGVSFAELFTACNSKVQKLKSDRIADAANAEQIETTAAVEAEGSN